MHLLRFLIQRLGQGVLIVLIVSFVIFALLRIVPGNPVRLIVGGMAPITVLEEKAEQFGLNDPIPVQYMRYLGNLLQGDMGESFMRPESGARTGGSSYDDPSRANRADVLDLILGALPYTLGLAGLALVFALLISVPLGVAAGLNPAKWQDKLAFYTSSVFVSLPNFWLGIVLILLVSARLDLLPAIGYEGFAYAILPAIVLAVELSPLITRTISVAMTETMQQHFIGVAEVRGLRRRQIVLRHGLRNSAVPALNLLGIQMSALLGGVVVIEYIFNYPGLGLLTIQAVLQRDFPLIQGIAIVTAAIFVLINIAVDLGAAAIDPRLES